MWLVGLNLGAFKINKVGLYSIDTKRERERGREERDTYKRAQRDDPSTAWEGDLQLFKHLHETNSINRQKCGGRKILFTCVSSSGDQEILSVITTDARARSPVVSSLVRFPVRKVTFPRASFPSTERACSGGLASLSIDQNTDLFVESLCDVV